MASALSKAFDRQRAREAQRNADLQKKALEEDAALEAKRKELEEAGTPFITTDKFGDLVFEKDSFYTDYKIDGKVVGKDFVFYDPLMSKAAKASNQVVRYTGGVSPEYRYTFVPENIIEKGFKTDDKQYYLGNILAGDNLDALSQKGVYVDLAGVGDFDKQFKDQGLSTKGFLIPYAETEQRQLFSNIKNYEIGKKSEDNTIKWGEIKGLSKSGDQYVYATDATPIGGVDQATGYINAQGLQGNWYKEPSGGGFLGDIGRAIADVPFGAELLGLATLNPYVYAAASGLRGGATGQDPLKVGLQTGLTAGLATELLGGAGTPQGTPGAVGGTPGVSEVFPVAPPNIGVSPLAPLPAGTGAGAGVGLLGADASFIAADAAQLAGQGLSEAAIAQNLVASGVNPANATLAANLAATGTAEATIANTLATMAPAGSTSLFTGGTAADLAAAGITAGGTGAAMSGADIAGGAAAGGAGAGTAAAGTTAGGNLLSNLFGEAAGGFLTDLLGAGINYGIDEATIKRLTDLAQQEKAKVQEGFRDLAAKSEVPFTPYTVSTGFGTSTFGPEQATTALSPEYAGIRDTAIAKSAEALGSINPATATQDYYNTLEALSAPTRQREQERLLGTLGSRGLLGFGQNMPTTGGMTRTVNPLMESLLSAQGTERLQQSLTAQQYGTSEAQRQAALSSSLLGMGTGLDTTALNQLSTTATLGQIPYQVDVANRERQIQQLENALRAGMPYDEAVFNLAMGKEANLGDFYRKTAENIFSEIFR